MTQLFVCHERDDIPRWRGAFGETRLLSPQQALAQAGHGDGVWVMSNIEDWPKLVTQLSHRGAIVRVLTYAPDAREGLRALDAGARGYAHALSPAALLQQVELVTSHQGIWVLPDLLAQVMGGAYRALGGSSPLQDEVLSSLTERERDVALAVAEGQTNKEVARQLEITERTVKAHLGTIFRKLGVRDRLQLILRLGQREIA